MATYYIAVTGSDSNPGSRALPWLTFAHADGIVQAGDTVVVQPGTYTLSGTFTSTSSGTAQAPINWISGNLAPWRAPGSNNNPIIAGGNTSLEFIQIIVKGNYVNWTGFEANEPTASVVFDIWGQHCKVSNCYIHDVMSSPAIAANTPGAGIFDLGSQGAAYNEFAYNIIVRMSIINTTNVSNAVVHGIYTAGSHNWIHHNICMAAPGYGIYSAGITNTNDHQILANNLCAENGTAGIAFGCGSGPAVDFMYCINNVLLNNGKAGGLGNGIREFGGNAQTGVNSIYDHNLTYGNTGAAYSLQNSLVATNQYMTAPIFRTYKSDGSGDYHTLRPSPTIGTGTGTLPVWNVTFAWATDLDGTTIPLGGRYDLGPYAYPVAPPTGQTFTTFQVGAYTATTDNFLTTVDLNDSANFFLLNGSPQVPQPQKVTVNSFNVRTPGETVVRIQYKNRHIKAALTIRGATPQAIVTNAHKLIAAVEGLPYTLRIALPQAATYSYADVRNCVHNIPSDPLKLQQLAIVKVELDFECYPFLRGDRVTLSNLCVNPGFEAPSGPGVQVFSDAISTVNAYSPQQYKTAVIADAPIRYYRLQEVTGTTAVDLGSQAQNGTYGGGFTLGQQPAPAGGADYDVLFNGTSGDVVLPTTGLPTANAIWSMDCLINIASNPAATVEVISLGTHANNSQHATLQITNTGVIQLTTGAVTISGATLTTAAWHHVAVTYDGTTLRIFTDSVAGGNTSSGGMTMTYGFATLAASCEASPRFFFPGQLAEVAIYSTTLSAARVTAHYNAGAPAVLATAPANTFVDVVLANGGANLLRFYRLGLADDATHAYDIAGNGRTGTPTASPTQQVAGLVSSDTDTCYTFNGTTQYVSLPTTGMPTGNSPISLRCAMKFAANPASNQVLFFYGTNANHQYLQAYVNSTGHIVGDFGTALVTSTGVITTGAAHDVLMTWDGTTGTLYVDGASTGTPVTPGANTIPNSANIYNIAQGASGAFFSGQIDEHTAYSAALSSTNATNIWNALHTGATGTLANAASLPATGQPAFGSPNWGAINTWNVRFRWVTGLTATFFAHYTDVNNSLSLAVKPTQLLLGHTVAGVFTQVAQATIAVQHEAWYWVSVTQFPAAPGNVPYLQAVLSYDNNGAIGAAITTLTGNAASSTAAVSGRPQINAAGATLVFGGVASGGGNAVSLFGPGGWIFQPISSGAGTTGPCSGAWDQTAANTYPNGPVTSFGCGRVDLAPAGTIDTTWRLYRGAGTDGGPAGTWAIPVATAGDVLNVSAYVKSSGLSSSAVLRLYVYEWDATGTFLRNGIVTTLTGNQAAWTQISGTYITGASCAYADLELRCIDTAVAGESANATVWWDNMQCYDQTATGQFSMPYCELRFPQSPAQLVVSGLLGDVQAPAQVSLGTYNASWANNVTLYSQIGRKAAVGAGAQFIAYTSVFSVVLDATSYGGFYTSLTTSNGPAQSLAAQKASDIQGTYHLLNRAWTSESTPSNVTFYAVAYDAPGSGTPGSYTTLASPLTVASTWQAVDGGQVTAPGSGLLPALSDLTVITTAFQAVVLDTSPVNWRQNWMALLPIDGGVCLLASRNQSGGPFTGYHFAYIDGLGQTIGGKGALAWGEPATALPVPTQGFGPSLANNNAVLAVTRTLASTADLFLTLDPTQSTPNAAGVNQLLAVNYSSDGAVWPTLTELQYSPLFLYPRV